MTDTVDTSAEAVERLAKALKRDIDWRPGSLCADAAATLRALAAERDSFRNYYLRMLEKADARDAPARYEFWRDKAIEADDAGQAAVADRDRLAAENARLREALREIATSDPTLFGGGPVAVGYHALRRIARAALGDKP
jgi:hypothetical protein